MFKNNRASRAIVIMVGFVVIAMSAVMPAYANSIVTSVHNFAAGGGSTGFSSNFLYTDQFGVQQVVDQVCVFCHTPHQAASNAAAPLWNRTAAPGLNYLMYSSSTMSATVPGSPQGVSALCMSCHDGVTSLAVGTLLNPPGDGPVSAQNFGGADGAIGDVYTGPGGFPDGWFANIGNQVPGGTDIDLRNDHPISIVYPTTKQGMWASPTNASLRLFGTAPNKTVECATCHTVHDDQNGKFLAMPNDGSQMCLACHDK